MKKYSIGGAEFALVPLTWKQRKLSSSFESKLREAFFKIGKAGKIDPSSGEKKLGKSLDNLFEITIQLDDILFGDDAPIRWLATILVRCDDSGRPEVWTEKSIEENVPILENVLEDQFGEIVLDFFGRAKKSTNGSTSSSPISENSSGQSIESLN